MNAPRRRMPKKNFSTSSRNLRQLVPENNKEYGKNNNQGANVNAHKKKTPHTLTRTIALKKKLTNGKNNKEKNSNRENNNAAEKRTQNDKNNKNNSNRVNNNAAKERTSNDKNNKNNSNRVNNNAAKERTSNGTKLLNNLHLENAVENAVRQNAPKGNNQGPRNSK
jgi:hypothetical protein